MHTKMETKRSKILVKILDDLRLFYTDLNILIVRYDAPCTWEKKASKSWTLQTWVNAFVGFQQYFYLCSSPYTDSNLLAYNTNGEIVRTNSTLKNPSGLDIDETNYLLYIADLTHVTVLNLKLEFVSSWKLPKEPPGTIDRGVKIDGRILYLTIDGLHQIFLCDSQNGKILTEFGNVNPSSKDGEFQYPYGVSVADQFIYICDCSNNRVQILRKESGIYFSKWGTGKRSTTQGQFTCPFSIYYNLSEDLMYIGDNFSVQLFMKDGTCIQRLGDKINGNQMNQFNVVYGICVLDDRLYVSDYGHLRIQIFERASLV